MNRTTVVKLLNAITPITSVVVAGFAVWMTHQERSSSYRSRLYDKQIECFDALLPQVVRLNLLLAFDHRYDEETKTQFNELTKTMHVTMPFLPSELWYPTVAVWESFHERMQTNTDTPSTKEQHTVYADFLKAARTALHTDRLTGEIRVLVPPILDARGPR